MTQVYATKPAVLTGPVVAKRGFVAVSVAIVPAAPRMVAAAKSKVRRNSCRHPSQTTLGDAAPRSQRLEAAALASLRREVAVLPRQSLEAARMTPREPAAANLESVPSSRLSSHDC